MSEGYTHLTGLDDPAKPYKRVYRCEATGVHVKVHAVRREVGFGKLKWSFTGSACGADGKAISDDQGKPLIHIEEHGLSVMTDRGIRYADARAVLQEFVRADDADAVAAVRRRARALFETPPSEDDLDAIVREDFERECLFMVAKVERAVLDRQRAANLGGVKPA